MSAFSLKQLFLSIILYLLVAPCPNIKYLLVIKFESPACGLQSKEMTVVEETPDPGSQSVKKVGIKC